MGNLAEVNQAIDDITNAWRRVQDGHDNYTEALEVEDHANETWIATEQEIYKRPRKKYFEYKINLQKVYLLEKAKHARSILEGDFDEQCLVLEKLISSQHSTECIIR